MGLAARPEPGIRTGLRRRRLSDDRQSAPLDGRDPSGRLQDVLVDVGAHTLEIRVVGTLGHPRVDIDVFAILR